MRQYGLPLLLLLLLGAATSKTNSTDVTLEDRLAKLERMLNGNERIDHIKVGNVYVAGKLQFDSFDDVHRIIISGSHLSFQTLKPESERAEVEEKLKTASTPVERIPLEQQRWNTDVWLSDKIQVGDVQIGARQIAIEDARRYRTAIGINETVSPDGTQHTSSAAKIMFFDPDGKVIREIP